MGLELSVPVVSSPPFLSQPQGVCPVLPTQMDPVQKAVISHTFGIPAPLKKRLCISCNICHLRLNSVVSGMGREGLSLPSALS